MVSFLPPLYAKIPVRLLLLEISDSYKMTAVKLWALTWKSHIHSTPDLDVNWLKTYLNLRRTQYFGHMAALHASGVLSWTRVGRSKLIVTFADWLDCRPDAGDPQAISLEETALSIPAPPIPAGDSVYCKPGGEESVLANSPGRSINLIFNDIKPPESSDSFRAETVRNPGTRFVQVRKTGREKESGSPGADRQASLGTGAVE